MPGSNQSTLAGGIQYPAPAPDFPPCQPRVEEQGLYRHCIVPECPDRYSCTPNPVCAAVWEGNPVPHSVIPGEVCRYKRLLPPEVVAQGVEDRKYVEHAIAYIYDGKGPTEPIISP